ncbi:sulfide reductase, subunit B [Pyrolobus fumarii 1A]|uniref:Sulfide reductase, subunit B n=1 Tax=Pyrolobus fumarii (strain DSM 11204 / 1A) TaxID=694429 RepID=G0EF73_PYRF1|nr:4Fe-4S dicluster domain-containing protein [Pyrolobus fumarii]AEM38970.1 sulfide reductase, subunit B [Pyrolobus fumarii 1A]
MSGERVERKENVNEMRRSLLKAAALASAASAITFVAVDKERLKKVLVPVKLEDILPEASAEGSELERKAAEKEKEMKRLCSEWTEKLCREQGEDSEACKEARKRCEMIKVKATPAKEGVHFAMALDLNKCIGCRRCAYACVMENNQARNLHIEWIKVLEMPREEMEFIYSKLDYTEAPKPDKVYVPVACMQCEDPPCVMVCPVRATWKEPDGIVVVDYDRCIGCRYCITACPYGARHFNWAKPYVPPTEINPNMHVLGNVIRQIHVVEKCTWCIQRTRDGGIPACVEVCPVGARVFGDLHDAESPIRRVIEEYGAFVLKPEAGTRPKFFYFFGPSRTPPRKEE